MTDRLLEWFGPSLHERLARVRDFWAGQGRCVVSLASTVAAYRQNLDAPDLLDRVEANLRAQARLPGVNLPAFAADFGTVSTAKHWGGEARVDPHSRQIYIEPVAATLDEALALTPRPVEDAALDAAQGLAIFHRLRSRLGSDALWLRTPDMQGTLNTAGLIMNQEELLMAMHEEPRRVDAFLERVCDLLIDYARFLRDASGHRVCGNIWPYIHLPQDMGVALTEDLMPLVSPEVYARFGLPHLQRIDRALGGVAVHCCGAWGRHVPTLRSAGLRLRAIEFHHPVTTIDEIAPLAERTVFVPYLLAHQENRFASLPQYCRHLLQTTPPHFRYWFALPGDDAESIAFAEEVEREYGR